MVPLSALGLTSEQAVALRDKWKVYFATQLAIFSSLFSPLNYFMFHQAEKEEAAAIAAPSDEDLDITSDANLDVDLAIITGDGLTQTSSSGNLEAEAAVGDAAAAGDETPARKLLILLEEKLPEVFTKQKADDFCVTFCYSNSKAARKKLLLHMSKIPRNRLELIPNYSRIIAALNKLFGDVGPPLVDSLFKDFYGMYKAKSQQHLESKIKNIRYLGELVKFKVAAPIVALKMFKLLLAEFTGHNIELFSVLMETCGRYLYLMAHTFEKMNEVIDTMVRFRRSRHFDLKQQTLLDSAFFSVRNSKLLRIFLYLLILAVAHCLGKASRAPRQEIENSLDHRPTICPLPFENETRADDSRYGMRL